MRLALGVHELTILAIPGHDARLLRRPPELLLLLLPRREATLRFLLVARNDAQYFVRLVRNALVEPRVSWAREMREKCFKAVSATRSVLFTAVSRLATSAESQSPSRWDKRAIVQRRCRKSMNARRKNHLMF